MNTSLNIAGRLMSFQEPKVMGIINATPDSFYTKGRNSDVDGALFVVEQMLADGAAIIDLGGQSTRPGAEAVDAAEEIKRVVPLVEAINKRFPNAIISIDTYYASVAKATVESGAHIINDISAGMLDEKMFQTISDLNVSYIMMHMQGNPKNMQQAPQYFNVVVDVLDFLQSRLALASAFGIYNVVLDVGFGFGKTLEQNYSLLKNLAAFEILKKPILVGVSRKSMVYKPLGIDAEMALNGSTVLHTLALERGAAILRVHDVRQAVEAVKLYKLLKNVE